MFIFNPKLRDFMLYLLCLDDWGNDFDVVVVDEGLGGRVSTYFNCVIAMTHFLSFFFQNVFYIAVYKNGTIV